MNTPENTPFCVIKQKHIQKHYDKLISGKEIKLRFQFQGETIDVSFRKGKTDQYDGEKLKNPLLFMTEERIHRIFNNLLSGEGWFLGFNTPQGYVEIGLIPKMKREHLGKPERFA